MFWLRNKKLNFLIVGVQQLSGRVLDSRPKGSGFEPHRRHCVGSLSKNINLSLVLVQSRKTCPFTTERLLMGRKESNQTKFLNYTLLFSFDVEEIVVIHVVRSTVAHW